MINKSKLIVPAMLFSLLLTSSVAFAQTSTTDNSMNTGATPTTSAVSRKDCLASAKSTRIAAIKSATDTLKAAKASAKQTRDDALKAAKTNADKKAANLAYASAVKDAVKTYTASVKSAWHDYTAAAKACPKK